MENGPPMRLRSGGVCGSPSAPLRKRMSADEQEAQRVHRLGSDSKGDACTGPGETKTRGASTPAAASAPQRDGPTSDGGRPCPAVNQRTHQQIVEAARYCQPALSARTTQPGRFCSGLSKGEQL